ncbi:SDR family NAD(P)-dependent oxidoreductase [bacterium]|nr:SDR family NAD(P)-dependent oxidoreductase [bacterium]
MTNEHVSRNPGEIAIIGMAGRFPGAGSIDEFWKNIRNGTQSISRFTDDELLSEGIPATLIRDKRYVKAKGIVENIVLFDADFFGYPPREAEKMDPQIRLLHHVAWESLEDGGYNPFEYQGLIGTFFGANENQTWLRHLEHRHGNPSETVDTFLVNYRDYVSTRIAYKLNLRGPSFTLLSACSTSLVAVHLACQSLLQGECDMALAGGVSITLPNKSGYLYQEGLMVSKDGRCRTFDAAADGTVFGDGAGVVLLKPLQKALDDRDPVVAIIKGSAINNDGGRKAGFTAPSIDGQQAVIVAAHRAAQVTADSIDYVEAHGTATRIGDPIEVKALARVFQNVNGHRCVLGSVKTNIGHVNIAAGVASLIKIVNMLKEKEIPPTLNFKKPNPEIDLKNIPFSINKKRISWQANGSPRRAGVSAFGFGGTNAHMIVEEVPQASAEKSCRPAQLLPVSARSESALERMEKNLSLAVCKKSVNLADVAYTLAVGRRSFSHRTWAIASGDGTLSFASPGKRKSADQALFKTTAFLFPGQGAQYPGMGKDLYEHEPVYRDIVDRCANILTPLIHEDIRNLLNADPHDESAAIKLKLTTFAQPAIFIVSYAMAKLWMHWGIKPAVLLGHSIGEYVAACVAGVFSMEEAVRLVAQRGKLMQSLPTGVMLAVTLSEEELISRMDTSFDLAAINAPSLTVVSGQEDFVAGFQEKLELEGVSSKYLHTSHAFHSRMMDSILEEFQKEIKKISFKAPAIPIISTVKGRLVTAKEITNARYWVDNVRMPVRFSEAVQKLKTDSQVILEVGPGRTLASLTRMHREQFSGIPVLSSLPGANESDKSFEFVLNTLGSLWSSGINIDWNIFFQYEKRKRISLPTYSFDYQRFPVQPFQVRPPSRWEQLHKEPDMDRWFSVPTWSRYVNQSQSEKTEIKGSCLVFAPSNGSCDLLIDTLRSRGLDVIPIYPGKGFEEKDNGYSLHPGHRCDYDSLFERLMALEKNLVRIIHCWTVDMPTPINLDDSLDDTQYLGFFSLLFLAQVMSQNNMTDEISLTVISDGLHDVLGGEVIRPEKATVLGAIKVIPQEYPNVFCRAIDLPLLTDFKSITEVLISEILNSDEEPMTALRNGYRWVQRFEPVKLETPSESWSIRDKGIYLITGGLGGLGLVLAEYLAEHSHARLALVSRSPLPERSKWSWLLRSRKTDKAIKKKIRAIRNIEKAGAEVLIFAADVCSEEDMRSVITDVDLKWGTIDGVIHAAGLTGEGILQLKRPESAEKIFAPKVKGTLILDRILGDRDLDFFLLCSSIASVLGGIGLGDYCAANCFLDAFAAQWHSRRRGSVISVNWDMWGEVGMGLTTQMPDELHSWLEKELRDGIMSNEGVEAFRRIIAWRGAPQIIVSTRDLDIRVDLWIRREILKEKERILEENAARPRYQRPSLTSAFKIPETDTEKVIAEIWSMLFGIDEIGQNDNFYELGGHSLLATTLISRLKKVVDANVSIRDVMDNPTVKELADVVDNSY